MNFVFIMVLGRIDPWRQPRGLWEPPFESQVPPERPYMINFWTPLPLYRNIVTSSVSTNNNKNVLLTVLLYCYSSTVPGYATTKTIGREKPIDLVSPPHPRQSIGRPWMECSNKNQLLMTTWIANTQRVVAAVNPSKSQGAYRKQVFQSFTVAHTIYYN